LKKLIAALVGLAVLAPGALAASSHFVKVSPAKVAAGKTVTVSGSVGSGCQTGKKSDSATIISKAFKGSKTNFAGVPSVSASLANSTNGSFSVKVKLSKKLKAGKYSVSGRCGGGNFGSTTLKVTAPGSTSGLPGEY
jgi:hypothetical protein